MANIDFNRSIGQAEKIKATDPRLKVDGNIVIGIYTDAHDKTCMTAYRIGYGPIVNNTTSSSMVKDNSGKLVDLPNFANVSFKKWISIMSAFYIIEKDKAIPVKELRDQRLANHNDRSNIVSKTLTDKVKEIVNRYGYSIRTINDIDGTNIFQISNNNRRSKIDIRHSSEDGFGIGISGVFISEDEANGDLKKAIELIHKLNQINLSRVGSIKED